MRFRAIVSVVLCVALLSPLLFSQNTKENADFKLAVNLFNDGLFDLAAEQLKQFIGSYPSTPQGVEARFYLGLSQMRLRRFDEARLTFQTFALTYQDNPRAPEAWWNVGESYAALGNSREAALAFERVKVFHPKSKLAGEALVRSGGAFLAAGAREDARRVLRIVLQEYPSTPAAMSARAKLAEIYFAEGNLDQAQGELKRVIDGDPSSEARAQALLLLGAIRQATGKPDLAQAHYQEVLTSYGQSTAATAARYQLGRLLVGSGRTKEGAELLRKAAAATGRADSLIARDALLALGDALVSSGDHDGATAAYERLLPLLRDPAEKPPVLWRIVRAAALGGEYRKSNEAGQKLLQAGAPDSLVRRTLVRLALNAEALKDAPRAVDLLAQFVERYPRDPFAPEVLAHGSALAERQLRDPRRALLISELLISRYGQSPLIDDAIYAAGRAEESMKEFDRAMARYRTLLARYPASSLAPEASARLRSVELFEAKDKDAGLEKLALLVGDVVAEKDRANLAYRLGEIYFTDLKNYDAAATQLRVAVELGLPEPASREARFLRSRALEYLSLRNPERKDEAIAAYEEFLSADSTRDRMATEAGEALFLLKAETPAGARSAAAAIAGRLPGFQERGAVQFRLAVLLEEADSVQAAARQYARFLQSAPGSPRAAEAAARLFMLLAQGNGSDSALAFGRRALRTHPNDPSAPRIASALGAMAYRLGKLDQAIEAYRTLLTEYFYAPEAATASVSLADALAARGEHEEALSIYRAAAERARENPLTEDPVDPGLLLAIGRTESRAGKSDEARRTLYGLLTTERKGRRAAEAYTILGEMAQGAGATEDATAFFRQASAADPSAAPTPEIAEMMFISGDHAEAIRLYERLVRAAPNDTARRFYASRVIVARLRKGDLAQAEKEIAAFAGKYRDAREDLATFDVERGNHYFRREEYPKALPIFQGVTKKYDGTPGAVEAMYRIGLTLEAMEKPKEALEVLTRLVEEHPDAPIIPRAHFAIGNLAYATEKWDVAVREYRVIVDDPNADPELLPVAMSNLIETYKIAGANDAALALTRTYLERFPARDDRLDKQITIGILYQRLGYYDQAVLHFQALLDEAGSDLEGELRYYIAESNFSKGDYQQAILDFLKVPYLVTKKGKFDWTANALYMAGQAYEKMGRYDQALTMYQQILERSGIDEVFRTAARKEIDRVKLVLKRGGK